MAVAFSTGGSGYTRSDFMISDAAIPARVEEAAKADQKEQFSKVLSGIGSFRNASNASNASNTSGAGSANNAVSGSDAASERWRRTMRYLRRKPLQGMRSSKCFAAN